MTLAPHQHRIGYVMDGVGYIPLTKGQVAIVDADQVEFLQKWNWTAAWFPKIGKFYAMRRVTINGSSCTASMARQLLGLPRESRLVADHKDRNPLNNRRDNLRAITKQQNAFNRGADRDNKTGVKGVSFHKHTGKYKAQIMVDGRVINLGIRSDVESAAELYRNASYLYHGDCGRTA